MKSKREKNFPLPTQANQDGEIGVRKDLDPAHLKETRNRYPGDSVDEHKELEEANEYIASKEIEQVDHNS